MEEAIDALPNAEFQTIFIPNLERILESGKISIIYRLLKERLGKAVFVISSTIPMPKEFYSLAFFYRVITYGIEELRPSKDHVRKYFLDREISLTDEELQKIEQDFGNQPLCLSMLELPLKKSEKGYCKLVKEQCFEELYSYIDITFFRFLEIKEQSILLKLSCFETINEEKVAFVMQSSYKLVQGFIKRMIQKGSILEEYEDGFHFYPVFHKFLRHMLHKYFTPKEIDDWYVQMITYFEEHDCYKDALYFAYILKKEDMMAEFMDKVLKEELERGMNDKENYFEFQFYYEIFFSLEKYYLRLSPYYLQLYPRLIFLGSILENFYGNRSGFYFYQRLLYKKLEQNDSGEEHLLIKGLLTYQKMFMTESFTLKNFQELLDEIYENSYLRKNCTWSFVPYHISILHGNKDYCKTFCVKDLKKILKSYDFMNENTQIFGKTIREFLLFMLAEFYYEQNELDMSLEIVMKSWKEARNSKNTRMQQLCAINMIDLFVAKNQYEQVKNFQVDNQDWKVKNTDLLYTQHFHAYQIRYYLNINDKEKILKWLEEEAPDEREYFYTTLYYVYLIKSRVYIWNDEYVRAKMLLQMLRNFAEEYEMYFLQIQVRILDAVIYYREKNERWKTELEEALFLGKEIGFIRVFADEGIILYEPLRLLIEGYSEEDIWYQDEYLKKVLDATRSQMMISPSYMTQEKLIDLSVFSTTEKNVMRLLSQGKKNAEMAVALCVSENTIKYHLKNIFRKLEVKNRTEAISRIHEIKIL